MTGATVQGRVESLWRFPVKSMLGERLEGAELAGGGFAGDRAWALIAADGGRVLSGKTPRLGPLLFRCRAALCRPPNGPEDRPPVRITLPDGAAVTSDDPDVDAALSRALGHEVHLARAAPADFTIDHYHPDIEGLDPQGHRDTVVPSRLGAALFAELGLPPVIPAGAFFDVFPVSVLTTSTLDRLHALQPGTRFDERRFRMNVIVRTDAEGFVENDWPGHDLAIGDQVRIRIAMPDPRCVMTTLAQDDLPRDLDVLRTLVRHNRLDVAGGAYPCAGVYATVGARGRIRAGDRVALA